METKEKIKSFDAVKTMRDARDRISADTQNMTISQLKKYLADKLQDSTLSELGK